MNGRIVIERICALLKSVLPPTTSGTARDPIADVTVVVSRDDVHPGDPAEPMRFTMPAGSPADDILRRASDPRWLPPIHDSLVTWSITSNGVLAVLRSDCRDGGHSVDVLPMPYPDERLRAADWRGGALHLHVTYHPHHDAETVFAVLHALRPGTGARDRA